MVAETVQNETCRVVYATVCEKCESVLSEEVRDDTFASIASKHLSEGSRSFYVYHDKLHKALFRNIIIEPGSCRSC